MIYSFSKMVQLLDSVPTLIRRYCSHFQWRMSDGAGSYLCRAESFCSGTKRSQALTGSAYSQPRLADNCIPTPPAEHEPLLMILHQGRESSRRCVLLRSQLRVGIAVIIGFGVYEMDDGSTSIVFAPGCPAIEDGESAAGSRLKSIRRIVATMPFVHLKDIWIRPTPGAMHRPGSNSLAAPTIVVPAGT